MNKSIIFLSEMTVTNGVIQSQLIPIVLDASKRGYECLIIETIGRFDSQDSGRDRVKKKLSENNIQLFQITIPRHTILPSMLYFSVKFYRTIRDIVGKDGQTECLIYARNYKFCATLLWLKRFYKIKYIYSPRGAYVAERKYYRRPKDLAYAFLIKFFEKRSILDSFSTIVETEEFKRYIENNYEIHQGIITVIPNYFDASLVPELDWDREKMRRELGFSGKKVIVYAGTAEIWYEFEKMFDLVSRLIKKDPSIFFQLFLKEDYARDESLDILSNIDKMAAKFGLERDVTFSISSYPPEERYSYLGACDAGICLSVDQKFKSMMLYLKIVDYIGAGLPLIVNSEITNAARVIKESGIGSVVNYRDWDRSISSIDAGMFFRRNTTEYPIIKKFSSLTVLPAYADLFDTAFLE